MFAHEPTQVVEGLQWQVWGASGMGKTASLRRIWRVTHIHIAKPLPSGKHHCVVLLQNLQGVLHTFWTTGSAHAAHRPAYFIYGPASGECPHIKGAFLMAAGPKVWSDQQIEQRLAEGRGQGAGDNYIPWVWVQEFSSAANQTRVPSVRLKRTIHMFSSLERAMYLWHEFHGFRDYREQFPMDRRITMGAAQALGIRHPRYPMSRGPTVMMMDALVIKEASGGKPVFEGWDAKPTYKLRDKRVRAKLSLHRAFCAYLDIPHNLFTEKSVPRNVMKSIEWARGGLKLEDEILPIEDFLDKEAEQMLDWLRSRNHRKCLVELGQTWDARRQLPHGTGLRLLKILVWRKQVLIELNQPELAWAILPDQRHLFPVEAANGSVLH